MGEWLLSRRDRLIVARHEGLYVFSAGHTTRRALYFGGFQSVARSGQESIAQGFNPELYTQLGGNGG
jgi:hypothetical protein